MSRRVEHSHLQALLGFSLQAELAQEKEKVREMTASAAAEDKPQKRVKKPRSPSTALRKKK